MEKADEATIALLDKDIGYKIKYDKQISRAAQHNPKRANYPILSNEKLIIMQA